MIVDGDVKTPENGEYVSVIDGLAEHQRSLSTRHRQVMLVSNRPRLPADRHRRRQIGQYVLN